jgi:hypothetical protein
MDCAILITSRANHCHVPAVCIMATGSVSLRLRQALTGILHPVTQHAYTLGLLSVAYVRASRTRPPHSPLLSQSGNDFTFVEVRSTFPLLERPSQCRYLLRCSITGQKPSPPLHPLPLLQILFRASDWTLSHRHHRSRPRQIRPRHIPGGWRTEAGGNTNTLRKSRR